MQSSQWPVDKRVTKYPGIIAAMKYYALIQACWLTGYLCVWTRPSQSPWSGKFSPIRTSYSVVSPFAVVGGNQVSIKRSTPESSNSSSLTEMFDMGAGGKDWLSIKQLCMRGIFLQKYCAFLSVLSWRLIHRQCVMCHIYRIYLYCICNKL